MQGARRFTPRTRRKIRLLWRRPVAFARIYCRNVSLKMRPLDNPPWYQEPPPLTFAHVRRALRDAVEEYADTWRSSTGRLSLREAPPPPAGASAQGSAAKAGAGAASTRGGEGSDGDFAPEPTWADRATAALSGFKQGSSVRVGSTEVEKPQSIGETVQSVKELGSQAAELGKTAAPVAKSFAAERLDIAKEALQEFVRGYRVGKKEQIMQALEEQAKLDMEAAHLQKDGTEAPPGAATGGAGFGGAAAAGAGSGAGAGAGVGAGTDTVGGGTAMGRPAEGAGTAAGATGAKRHATEPPVQ